MRRLAILLRLSLTLVAAACSSVGTTTSHGGIVTAEVRAN